MVREHLVHDALFSMAACGQLIEFLGATPHRLVDGFDIVVARFGIKTHGQRRTDRRAKVRTFRFTLWRGDGLRGLFRRPPAL